MTEDILKLPDLPGIGNLYSLRQAVMRDGSGELKGLLEQFVVEKDSVVRRSLLDRIVLKWGSISDAIANNYAQI